MNWFKFSIPSLDCFKLVMTLATLKIRSISIYDPTTPRTWQARKKNVQKLPTKLKCFQFLLEILQVVDIIATHFLMWTWLHHHLIQFAQKKVIIINCCCPNRVQMKKHLQQKRAHNINVITYHNLNDMCMAHKI